MSYRQGLLLLALAISGGAAAAPDGQTINVVFLDPSQVPPKTPEELREERIHIFVNEAKFAGTVGVSSDPQHFSTEDTIPVHRFDSEDPGSLLRDTPFVQEIMRLDQLLMRQAQPTVAGPLSNSDLDAPFVGTDRQFDLKSQLAGCAGQTRLLGSVNGRGSRRLINVMLPERKIAVVLSVANAKFELGDLGKGSGFLPRLLSLAACP